MIFFVYPQANELGGVDLYGISKRGSTKRDEYCVHLSFHQKSRTMGDGVGATMGASVGAGVGDEVGAGVGVEVNSGVGVGLL